MSSPPAASLDLRGCAVLLLPGPESSRTLHRVDFVLRPSITVGSRDNGSLWQGSISTISPYTWHPEGSRDCLLNESWMVATRRWRSTFSPVLQQRLRTKQWFSSAALQVRSLDQQHCYRMFSSRPTTWETWGWGPVIYILTSPSSAWFWGTLKSETHWFSGLHPGLMAGGLI